MKLIITCEGGHVQEIPLEGMSLSYAQDFASILDGTSNFFTKPREEWGESGVGKCGVCDEWFRAEVEETR